MAELLPNFYKVTHSEHINETDWVVQVMLNPQHAIYSGHFPQQPVVPGVCMLQIIKECIEKIQQAPLQYKQIASCKFLSVINPNETPELELSLTIKKNETDTFQILAEGASSKDICIKLKAQLIGK
ncbi:ApeI family dehydratase [Bacteroides cellulosilyticus]|jgi:hypothetical protein|uniref:ApeI family dehydratase n=1 Tax=Bacteroides cellulosilyticus TaxID=246787 RepID=UPI00189AF584|nr:hydroxymyristoyl-ACP dehydratase [Bacteroides cellulosilyticus]